MRAFHRAGSRPELLALFGGIGLINLALWLLALATFRHAPILLGSAVVAYGFGLRHAVDADHIAAIDNVTRKLMQEGQRPMSVGLFFSLGHATVVFALAAAVGAGGLALKSHLGGFQDFGGVFGTAVSAAFLAVIALANALVLAALLRARGEMRRGTWREPAVPLAAGGLLSRLFGPLFGLIRRPWQMYPVGLLFGLGFDTATEIGLLALTAAGGARRLPLWSVMLLPALFTAGMAMLDTADGVLILATYGRAMADPARRMSYNIVLTALSITVAGVVGLVEVLGLLQGELGWSNVFWDAIAVVNNDFGVFGAGIVALFVLCWAISVTLGRDRRVLPARS